MTIKEAKQTLAAIGYTLRKTEHGEYRINKRGANEQTAYYAGDLADAVRTAKFEALRTEQVRIERADAELKPDQILREIYNLIRDGERAAEVNEFSRMDALEARLRHYVGLIPDALDIPLSERL